MEMSQKPPTGKKIKARAPPPPQLNSKPCMEHMSSTESDGTGNQSPEESKENVLHRKVDITVCLPDGQEETVVVDGSKAVMDFLVDLCSQHHLNPAQHTLEARSGASQQPFLLRPNTLIGTLDLQTIFLKEKVTEVKVRKPAPKIPEKTVRLVVNYLGTHKAVVRVNPSVPLWNILPAVCEKCEFNHENVTLLRDVISKEELDMSQSLNDLGIKELYAWNNKQGKEKNRKLSSGSDTAEKEKRGILGFFRSNKKGNKNETIGRVDSDEYEEIFHSASTSGNRCEGFSTAPSSPSVNSRSFALGSSLSMSNISGIGSGTEVKKRRAPPPPRPAPPNIAAIKPPEDKITEPLYATVQKEQQKKKRRAPPPPPPPPPAPATAQMPNEKNEDLDKRKSSISNGRQVPQKPPRGTSRSPPHLEIPPPPPYPPPDNDIMESSIFENGVAITGTTKPIPAKRGKILTRSSSITSEEVLTTDDAGSVNSYTEDSGIVSSPSDSVSLDLQTDSCKKSENTNNDTHKAHPQPARAGSFNSDDSWSLNTSSTQLEDEVTSVRNGDEDIFITSQFQETLAELDADSEDMDDGDHTKSNAQSSPVGGESNQLHEYKESGSVVPVTIIDEIPEVATYSPKYNVHPVAPANDLIVKQRTSAVNNTTNYSSISNNENHSIKTYKPHSTVQSPSSPTRQTSGGSFKQSKDILKQPTSINVHSSNTCESPQNAVESPSFNTPESVFPIKMENSLKPANNKANQMLDNRQKLGTKDIQAPQNETNKVAETTKPVLWRQQTYEPKAGMTTFTVVPPKPSVKKYDRGVSLTSSAIKIDDQGNLISPQSSFDRSDSFTNGESTFVEKPLVARAKEFWRSSSMDAQGAETKEQPGKRVAPVKNLLENRSIFTSSEGITQQIHVNNLNGKRNTLQQNKTISTTLPKENVIIIENTTKKTDTPLLRPTLNDKQLKQGNETFRGNSYKGKLDQGHASSDRTPSTQQIKPNLSSTSSKEKVIIIEKTNQQKPEIPFLKPSKRTSSQYVASAIFKYTEPLNKQSLEATEVKRDSDSNNRSLAFRETPIKINTNITIEKAKTEARSVPEKETYMEMKTNLGNKDGQLTNKMQSFNINSSLHKTPSEFKKDDVLSKTQQFNGPANGNMTILEKNEKKPATVSPRILPTSNVSSNAFLKAVREKSMKIEQANAFVSTKTPATTVTIIEKEDKHVIDTIPSTVIDEPDSTDSNNVFGPKTKFRAVVQKPLQKDDSLHSALMGAIQSGEGKEKLRKIQSSPTDGEEKKVCEPENERSALLSAIRGHNGISRLKKVSSAAADELQSIRKTEKHNELASTNTLSIPSPPTMPPPPPPPTMPPPPPPPVIPPPSTPVLISTAPKSPQVFTNNSVDVREALMEAIRSGQAASKLKKVSASVRTL